MEMVRPESSLSMQEVYQALLMKKMVLERALNSYCAGIASLPVPAKVAIPGSRLDGESARIQEVPASHVTATENVIWLGCTEGGVTLQTLSKPPLAHVQDEAHGLATARNMPVSSESNQHDEIDYELERLMDAYENDPYMSRYSEAATDGGDLLEEDDDVGQKQRGSRRFRRAGILPEGTTTVMVKGLPSRCTHPDLIHMLEEASSLGGKYDFVYIPCDFKTKVNAGYAFVNFVLEEDALALAKEWHNQWIFNNEVDQPCRVAPAYIQGSEALAAMCNRRKLQRIRNPAFRPVSLVQQRS
mmetsp:Transcript_17355/g.40470  ORF Transcript_17355/g.40470 Transcript_17355/m.40470 type:complete len:300 (+) Transcript_17355:114-1013(+)